MSGKTTKQRNRVRMVLAEARASDMRVILQRIITINPVDDPELAAKLAKNAIDQDDQRLQPEKLRRAMREVEATLRETENK